jgi:hypothetical protein
VPFVAPAAAALAADCAPAGRIRLSWLHSARAFAAQLVALAGFSAIVFLPDRVPDIVGP